MTIRSAIRRPTRRRRPRSQVSHCAGVGVSYSVTRMDNTTRVTVSGRLTGNVFYYWYLDGAFVGRSQSNSRSFVLAHNDMVRVEVIETYDADFDAEANAPAGWPGRRTLWWIRSTDADVDHYRVEQAYGAGDFAEIATVQAVAGQWEYEVLSPRLLDLSGYTWQVVPVDAAGNDGTALEIAQEVIVRTPDAPDFAIAFDEGTTKVTFSAA